MSVVSTTNKTDCHDVTYYDVLYSFVVCSTQIDDVQIGLRLKKNSINSSMVCPFTSSEIQIFLLESKIFVTLCLVYLHFYHGFV